MLEEAKMTNGIGARTARSIQCTSTKRRLWNRLLISVNNAKQKKKPESAYFEEIIRVN
jgi:hypothetical protein